MAPSRDVLETGQKETAREKAGIVQQLAFPVILQNDRITFTLKEELVKS